MPENSSSKDEEYLLGHLLSQEVPAKFWVLRSGCLFDIKRFGKMKKMSDLKFYFILNFNLSLSFNRYQNHLNQRWLSGAFPFSSTLWLVHSSGSSSTTSKLSWDLSFFFLFFFGSAVATTSAALSFCWRLSTSLSCLVLLEDFLSRFFPEEPFMLLSGLCLS